MLLTRRLITRPNHGESNMQLDNWKFIHELVTIVVTNKKTPEGVYAGCVAVRKNYRYVE